MSGNLGFIQIHGVHTPHTFTGCAWPSHNGPRTTKTNKNGGLFHVKQHLCQSCGNVSNSTCGGLSPYDCRSFLHQLRRSKWARDIVALKLQTGCYSFRGHSSSALELYVIIEEVGDSFAKSWGKHSELHRPTSLIDKSPSVNIFAYTGSNGIWLSEFEGQNAIRVIIIFQHFPCQKRNFGAPPQRQRTLLQLLRLFASVRSGFQLFSPRRVLLIRMAIWVYLKIGYTPNYSHLVGIMIINHWVKRGVPYFQTNPFGGLYHIFHLQWIIMDLSNFWDVSIHFGWEGSSFVLRPSRRSKFLICALTGCRARISREFTPAGRFLKRVWAKQQPEASQMVISCHLDWSKIIMSWCRDDISWNKPFQPMFKALESNLLRVKPPHFDASSWACGIIFIHFPLAPPQPCKLHIPGGFGHLWKVIFSFQYVLMLNILIHSGNLDFL